MSENKKVIILGTAHLGTTPGKCAPDKSIREAVYSRERIEAIEAILKSYGYTVYVDHRSLEPHRLMKAGTAKAQQSRELNFRVDFVNSLCRGYGPQNCIYVSLHLDAAGDDGKWMNAGGWSCFTSPGQTQADILAECFYDAAEVNLADYKIAMARGKRNGDYGKNQNPIRTDLTDGDRDKEASYYVLTKTACPAVLTENLFQDNRADVAFLLSEAGKHAIERLHVEAIIAYLDRLK